MGEKKLWIGKLRVEVGEWRTGVCGLRKTGLQAGIEVKNVVIWFLPADYFQTVFQVQSQSFHSKCVLCC